MDSERKKLDDAVVNFTFTLSEKAAADVEDGLLFLKGSETFQRGCETCQPFSREQEHYMLLAMGRE